jgi:hypothetical protein
MGARRQAETIPKEGFGHVAAHTFAASEDRLQVHGFPDGAGFDIFGFQGQAEGRPVRKMSGKGQIIGRRVQTATA